MTAEESASAFMRRAIELAEHGRGLTSPNPMVGAVIVAPGGEVVGEGFHARAGAAARRGRGPAGGRPAARGATVYVTLEPCAHHGRTPPCARRARRRGCGARGRGGRRPQPARVGQGLRRASPGGHRGGHGRGSRAEAEGQNRVFLTAMRERRPARHPEGRHDARRQDRRPPRRFTVDHGGAGPGARSPASQRGGRASSWGSGPCCATIPSSPCGWDGPGPASRSGSCSIREPEHRARRASIRAGISGAAR